MTRPKISEDSSSSAGVPQGASIGTAASGLQVIRAPDAELLLRYFIEVIAVRSRLNSAFSFIDVAAVGAFGAQTVVSLLRRFPSLRLHHVDANSVKEEVSTTKLTARNFALPVVEQTRQFEDRLVRVCRGSLEGAQVLRRGSLHLIFLAGLAGRTNHSAELSAWWPLLSEGGVLAGDAYQDASPRVMGAVRSFAARNGIRPELTPDEGLWSLWKPTPAGSKEYRFWPLELRGLSLGGGRWPRERRKEELHLQPRVLVDVLFDRPSSASCWTGHSERFRAECCSALRDIRRCSPLCPDIVECCKPFYTYLRAPVSQRLPGSPSLPGTARFESRGSQRQLRKLAAVLVIGQRRTILDEVQEGQSVAANIQQNLFQHMLLSAYGEEGAGFDVFWLLDTRGQQAEPRPGDVHACEPLRPIGCSSCSLYCHVAQEEDIDVGGFPNSVLSATWENRIQSAFYTILAFRRVFALLQKHMELERVQYDWIIRIRPDAYYFGPLPRIEHLPSSPRALIVGRQIAFDYFAVGRPSAMKVFMRAADGLNQSAMLYRLANTWIELEVDNRVEGFINKWGTEEILLNWLDMNGMFVVAHPDIEVELKRRIPGLSGFSSP